jgi:hypothetical protein
MPQPQKITRLARRSQESFFMIFSFLGLTF